VWRCIHYVVRGQHTTSFFNHHAGSACTVCALFYNLSFLAWMNPKFFCRTRISRNYRNFSDCMSSLVTAQVVW